MKQPFAHRRLLYATSPFELYALCTLHSALCPLPYALPL